MTSHEQTMRMAGGLRMAGQIDQSQPPAAPDGLFVARRDGAEIFLPTTGGPVTLTSAAASWTFGPWVAIGTPSDEFYATSWLGIWQGTPFGISGCVVEFAYGPDKNPIDAYRSNSIVQDPTGDSTTYGNFNFPGRPVHVPGGEPIYARLATAWNTPQTMHIILFGYLGAVPDFEALPANLASNGRYLPSNNASTGIYVQHGGAWAWGTPATILDPVPNDMLVTQVIPYLELALVIASATLYQVGYGAAGAETWCVTQGSGRTLAPPIFWPPALVKAGERLAVRATYSGVYSYDFRVLLKVYDL